MAATICSSISLTQFHYILPYNTKREISNCYNAAKFAIWATSFNLWRSASDACSRYIHNDSCDIVPQDWMRWGCGNLHLRPYEACEILYEFENQPKFRCCMVQDSYWRYVQRVWTVLPATQRNNILYTQPTNFFLFLFQPSDFKAEKQQIL